ncbi:MAG: hypothetical protein ABIK28_15990, partial [Planctomycetota bacterium]
LHRPGLWRHFLMMFTTTAFLYAFLAFYFFRSPYYVLLTTPLIVTFAAGAAMLMAGHLQHRLGIRLPWFQGFLLVAAAAQLFPCLGEARLFHKEGDDKMRVKETLTVVGHIIENNAVVVSGGNPVAAEYIMIRHTQRKFLYLTQRQDPPLKRMFLRELGEESITPEGVERYVRRHLEAGTPVYCLLGYPDEDSDYPLLNEVFSRLKNAFDVGQTEHDLLKRLTLEGKPPARGKAE